MPAPPAARSHYLWSAALVQRAVSRARTARPQGLAAVAGAVAAHQATAASQADPAVALMLLQQGYEVPADAALNLAAFTTTADSVAAMLEQAEVDWQFERLVATLVGDAGRAAEQAATATRKGIGYVRYLSPPSCSRCAVLAGRVYRYSSGFLRHPQCDCTMIPTTLANPDYVHDPVSLMRRGLVTGMSKADQRAVRDGADFGRVVNRHRTGLRTPGRSITRPGRPTPESIYKAARTREEALSALAAAGYIR